MSFISNLAIPAVILIIVLSGFIKGIPVFDVFLEGLSAMSAFVCCPLWWELS